MSVWIRWILAISVLYFGAVSYWYVFHHKAYSQSGSSARAAMPSEAAAVPPIAFYFRAASAKTTKAFAPFQRQLIQSGKPEDALLITGLYFSDENNQQVPNLGELRAQEAARQFKTMLPLERIKTASRLEPRPAPSQSKRFEALDLAWVALNAPVPLIAPPEPLVFASGTAIAATGSDFDAFKAAFGRGADSQQFEITGVWYQSEVNAAGARDLGLERAKAARALFADVIAPGRTQLRSLLLSDSLPDSPFAAARFRWIDALPAQDVQGNQQLTLYFAVGKSTAILSKAETAQLKAFVSAANGKRVVVTGHTDTTGSSLKNRILAGDRAQFLAEALRSAGIKAEVLKASIASEAPKGSNATIAGRNQNRRAEASIR